jgi:uncharacterized protein GlcG (DUF336 family)
MQASTKKRFRSIAVISACTLLLFVSQFRFRSVDAQSTAPVLVSRDDSTRAIAFDSVTRQREPFTATAPVVFGADSVTRLMLFAMNLRLQSGENANAVTADAEDVNHRIYQLPVEHVGPVPDQPWATSIVVKLAADMTDLGDVLVRITYRGVASNRVRLAIGHVGGGPPDDSGAVPTPGSELSGPSPSPRPLTATNLTPSDVETILAQAASAAIQLGHPVNIVILDREANVLGFLPMPGTPATSTVRSVGAAGSGLEGASVPSSQVAIAKAATAAFFSTSGNAFSTRTAGFIIQEHFPPGISFRPGGPLYGVQFSSLPCSDIKRPSARLGLSGDPGGLPIYKDGLPAGGIGIEGDGLYTVDRNPTDLDQPFEELIAASGVRGFEPSTTIRGDNILVDGIRLPYSNVGNPPAPATIPFASLPGTPLITFGPGGVPPDSEFIPAVVGGIAGQVNPRFFPFTGGTSPAGAAALTAAEVNTIISLAAQQSNITRAAIRQPLGSNARVSISVVDAAGVVLGVFRQKDAPVFGFDVAVQKARSAAFFSNSAAATLLRGAGFGSFADRALADGLRLDGSIAFSDRAVGFLHRPFFPDGIDNTAAGPFSTSIGAWSPFNVGLQLDLVKTNFLIALGGTPVPCTSIPNLANGIQIFAGSVPLYKNGVLVGAIGISGDGIDQDDLIGAAGANGFSPPAGIRSDQIFVRGVRLPFLKFPRSPNL